MSWCGSVCDWTEDNVIDPVEELVDEATQWADSNIVEPIEDTIESTVDGIVDLADSLWTETQELSEKIKELGDAIRQKLEESWEDFKGRADQLAHQIWSYMEQAWDGLIDTLDKWNEWVSEQVSTAAEWLRNAADAAIAWFVDDLIPWLWTVIKAPWVLIKFVAALVVAAVCWLVSRFTTAEPVKVIQAVTERDYEALDEFLIETLPSENRYVVFSDIHLFTDGDFDYYNRNGNADIHRLALSHYGAEGFHLIENGDIEDFWMRGGSLKGAIYDVADSLPYPAYYEAYVNEASWNMAEWHVANVFGNNSSTYALVDQLFVERGKYSRTVGNHDDAWDDPRMCEMLRLVFGSPVRANDYIVLESSRGDAEVVIAHGHQSDIFNMRMCDFAGKSITEAMCWVQEISIGAFGKLKKFYETRDEWESDLAGRGFDNEIHGMQKLGLGQSLDEVQLYEDLESIYGKSSRQPHLILGHTHNIKNDPGVPNYMFKEEWEWSEYTNTGTTGMWEGIVTCVEISYPDISTVAWYRKDGALRRDELRSYRFGEVYLQ